MTPYVGRDLGQHYFQLWNDDIINTATIMSMCCIRTVWLLTLGILHFKRDLTDCIVEHLLPMSIKCTSDMAVQRGLNFISESEKPMIEDPVWIYCVDTQWIPRYWGFSGSAATCGAGTLYSTKQKDWFTFANEKYSNKYKTWMLWIIWNKLTIWLQDFTFQLPLNIFLVSSNEYL